MKQKYYGWHWLNVEAGDSVYYYSHRKLYKQTVLQVTPYFRHIDYISGRGETFMDYIIVDVIGKNNRRTNFRFNIGTSETELGYGRDVNGNLRFSCKEAVKEYFNTKKKYAECLVRYYKYMTDKNKEIIKQIDNLNIKNI